MIGFVKSVIRGFRRSRPTLKPSTEIVSKAQEFIDIYRYPPSRPAPIYPTPQVDKPAAKCRKDVCLLPDCSCGGADIPGEHANCFLIGSTLDVRQKEEEEEEEK